jgi:hypothetical protein
MSQKAVTLTMDDLLDIVLALTQASGVRPQTAEYRDGYQAALLDLMRQVKARIGGMDRPIITFDKPGH